MSLVVEDGTGKADAESYGSVTDMRAYCVARKMDLGTLADGDLEAALRVATQYIDGRYRFRDVRKTTTQALMFPRSDAAVDFDGQSFTGVPLRLKQGTFELAFTSEGGASDLLPATERGGLIKSETIGPLSTTYMDGAPPGPAYLKVDNMLRPYIRLDSLPPVPVNMGPTDAPFFGVELHDSIYGPTPGAEEQDLTE